MTGGISAIDSEKFWFFDSKERKNVPFFNIICLNIDVFALPSLGFQELNGPIE